jgi:shikimate kinase
LTGFQAYDKIKDMNNIYLVGFMGTGKTSVGKELAKKKKWHFIDIDELIELKEKRVIADIFTQSKEPYFRRVERQALEEVAKEKKFVVACGGGIVLNKDNIRIMKETGVVICLSALPEVILQRTSKQTNRPLLYVSDPKGKIDLLLKLRAPYYALADKTIETSSSSVKEVVEKVTKLLAKKRKITLPKTNPTEFQKKLKKQRRKAKVRL